MATLKIYPSFKRGRAPQELPDPVAASIVVDRAGNHLGEWADSVGGAAVAALVALQTEPDNVPPWINGTLVAFLVLTVIFTVYSGAGYVKSAARILRSTE